MAGCRSRPTRDIPRQLRLTNAGCDTGGLGVAVADERSKQAAATGVVNAVEVGTA